MSEELDKDLSHPLYEFTQVITQEELQALVEELFIVYHSTSWFKWHDKFKLAGGFSVAKILLQWLQAGKPYDVLFMRNRRKKGENNEQVN